MRRTLTVLAMVLLTSCACARPAVPFTDVDSCTDYCREGEFIYVDCLHACINKPHLKPIPGEGEDVEETYANAGSWPGGGDACLSTVVDS